MTKALAIVSTVSVAGLLAARALEAPNAILLAFLLIAVPTLVALLVRGYPLAAQAGTDRALDRIARAHIALHAVPAAYLAVQATTPMTLALQTLFFIPVMLFFLTGWWVWKSMGERFGGKLYRFFLSGNLGMAVILPPLLALGWAYGERLGIELFPKALVGYLVVHMLLTGIAVVALERDLSAPAVPQTVPDGR